MYGWTVYFVPLLYLFPELVPYCFIAKVLQYIFCLVEWCFFFN